MMSNLPPVDSQPLVPPHSGVLFWPFSLMGPLKKMADAGISPSWSNVKVAAREC